MLGWYWVLGQDGRLLVRYLRYPLADARGFDFFLACHWVKICAAQLYISCHGLGGGRGERLRASAASAPSNLKMFNYTTQLITHRMYM